MSDTNLSLSRQLSALLQCLTLYHLLGHPFQHARLPLYYNLPGLSLTLPPFRRPIQLHLQAVRPQLSRYFLPLSAKQHLPMRQMLRSVRQLSILDPMFELPKRLHLLLDQLLMFACLSQYALPGQCYLRTVLCSLRHLHQCDGVSELFGGVL
jgi:hypothetical protein